MEEKTVVVEQQTDVVEVITTETGSLQIEETLQTSEEDKRPIVVTGFGQLDQEDQTTNFSETIMKQFYEQKEHKGKFEYGSEKIDIVTGPWTTPKAISVQYCKVEELDSWLKNSDARLYVHLGVDSGYDNKVYFEQRAYNIPVDKETGKHIGWQSDSNGKTFHGKCEEEGPDYLDTSFCIQELICRVQSKMESNGHSITLHKSENAGNSLCNFLYYRSLYHAKKRNQKCNVLFIHVPYIPDGTTASDFVSMLDIVIHCLLDKPIVVTGFGQLKSSSETNFSETVMKRFYDDHEGKFRYGTEGNYEEIDIVTGPWCTPKAIPVRYSDVEGEDFDSWLRSSDARLYIHLGETKNHEARGEDGTPQPNPHFFEKQAKNCPGKDPKTGKCGWTTENGENNDGEVCVPGGEDTLQTSFDISSVIDDVGSQITVGIEYDGSMYYSVYSITPKPSCDAGTSLCDFLYYRSLYYAKKLRNSANVLFIHVPHFSPEELKHEEMQASKVEIYVAVLNKVIKCLLDTQTPSLQTPSLQTPSLQTKEQISLDIESDLTPEGEWEESITLTTSVSHKTVKRAANTKKQAKESKRRRRQKRNARHRNRK